MRVVDTSAWLEWFAGWTVGRSVNGEMPEQERHVIPTMVQHELAVWANRELSEARADEILADATRGIVVALTTTIALRAANARRDYKLPTADAIVYATALEYKADLLTCDFHFKDLPRVIFVPKITG